MRGLRLGGWRRGRPSCSECGALLAGRQRVVCSKTCAERCRDRLHVERNLEGYGGAGAAKAGARDVVRRQRRAKRGHALVRAGQMDRVLALLAAPMDSGEFAAALARRPWPSTGTRDAGRARVDLKLDELEFDPVAGRINEFDEWERES